MATKLNEIRHVIDDALAAVNRACMFSMSKDHAVDTERTAIEKLKKLRDALNNAGDDFTDTAASAMLNKMLKTN